jgi:hypothetical protein
VGLNFAFVSNDRAGADHNVGSDFDLRAKLRRGFNKGRWMDFHRTPASLKLKYG